MPIGKAELARPPECRPATISADLRVARRTCRLHLVLNNVRNRAGQQAVADRPSPPRRARSPGHPGSTSPCAAAASPGYPMKALG